MPAAITVFTFRGAPISQNPASVLYFGDRGCRGDAAAATGHYCAAPLLSPQPAAAAHQQTAALDMLISGGAAGMGSGVSLLQQVFVFEPEKLERMLAELLREGGSGFWKGVLRVPQSLAGGAASPASGRGSSSTVALLPVAFGDLSTCGGSRAIISGVTPPSGCMQHAAPGDTRALRGGLSPDASSGGNRFARLAAMCSFQPAASRAPAAEASNAIDIPRAHSFGMGAATHRHPAPCGSMPAGATGRAAAASPSGGGGGGSGSPFDAAHTRRPLRRCASTHFGGGSSSTGFMGGAMADPLATSTFGLVMAESGPQQHHAAAAAAPATTELAYRCGGGMRLAISAAATPAAALASFLQASPRGPAAAATAAAVAKSAASSTPSTLELMPSDAHFRRGSSGYARRRAGASAVGHCGAPTVPVYVAATTAATEGGATPKRPLRCVSQPVPLAHERYGHPQPQPSLGRSPPEAEPPTRLLRPIDVTSKCGSLAAAAGTPTAAAAAAAAAAGGASASSAAVTPRLRALAFASSLRGAPPSTQLLLANASNASTSSLLRGEAGDRSSLHRQDSFYRQQPAPQPAPQPNAAGEAGVGGGPPVAARLLLSPSASFLRPTAAAGFTRQPSALGFARAMSVDLSAAAAGRCLSPVVPSWHTAAAMATAGRTAPGMVASGEVATAAHAPGSATGATSRSTGGGVGGQCRPFKALSLQRLRPSVDAAHLSSSAAARPFQMLPAGPHRGSSGGSMPPMGRPSAAAAGHASPSAGGRSPSDCPPSASCHGGRLLRPSQQQGTAAQAAAAAAARMLLCQQVEQQQLSPRCQGDGHVGGLLDAQWALLDAAPPAAAEAVEAPSAMRLEWGRGSRNRPRQQQPQRHGLPYEEAASLGSPVPRVSEATEEHEEGKEEAVEEEKQEEESGVMPEAAWHEIWATRSMDPTTRQYVIVLTQHDVSAKVMAERHLANVMEAEHRLLEQLFPKHILTHITEEWTQEAERAAAGLAAPGDGAGSPAGGAMKAGAAGGPNRNLRWRPVVKDCNALATWHPEVTLLFADIRGFTPMCKEVSPRAVMTMLNDLFSRFDAMLDDFGVFKVETIGDCYFIAGGLMHEGADGMAAVRCGNTKADPLHANKVFMFAKAMLAAAREVKMPSTGEPVQIRIGVSSGPVVSGVVGTRMPRFCLFGDTVNTTSRMESTGVPGAIHASENTFQLLPSEAWQPTGGIEVKGKGPMLTYL
ncbi:hypothetical protein HXX76_008013 [Chlamydomonas incerta]|uniref:Guanylate cyclase domain-containing protein n=1 Tax=Chlamydomonas incerta TaxID=51695 RepID=A0A835SW41_CHLIN|nr:hypothetical protein HXX76_008013 [Chlamydomonas incerta]|eukprot:KAG2434289.1 hypothetical protein HXX76_008013 [Chlamydomonas incerta]